MPKYEGKLNFNFLSIPEKGDVVREKKEKVREYSKVGPGLKKRTLAMKNRKTPENQIFCKKIY